MNTCKDCIHFSICSELTNEYFDWNKFSSKEVEKICNNFIDKTKIIELPCAIGQEVYVIEECGCFQNDIEECREL